ncbi:helix-turn-helix domain-containing protein [Methylocystis sp. IM4]|uniref:helix-turn-helix domain-containing protein n=1 Tax=Methylocystis sp. IM4 TaxID=3136560 RepID=UPI003119C509
MEPHVATTPFGRRPMTLTLIATQAAACDFAAQTNSSNSAVHKWRLFQALTEAKTHFNVTDRDLSVLHALLSFHPETALTLPTWAGRPGNPTGATLAPLFFRPTMRCRCGPMAWRPRRCGAISPRSSPPA